MGLALLSATLLGFAANAKLKAKFDSMMTECTLEPKALELIDDRRMRTLFRGVSAAAADDNVRTAFQIVYEDLGPVRVAGDLIFGKLKRVASDATLRSAPLVDTLDLDESTLTATRALFDALDGDASGGLDRQELLDSPELLKLLQSDGEPGEAAVDRFLSAADTDGDGQVSFLEYCLYAASEGDSVAFAGAQVQAALESSVQKRRDAASNEPDAKHRRGTPTERFDGMLTTCLEWEEALQLADCTIEPDPEECEVEQGRFAMVLKGSFVGARNDKVAKALRLCYEEYSALRFGGDIIFAVLKRIVKAKLKGKPVSG